MKRSKDDSQMLGLMLKEARQRKNLTLKELSSHPQINTSMNFLSRIERGEAFPSDELLLKLAKNLDMDIEEALLLLFREKASADVREYLPSASFLAIRESVGEIEQWNLQERSTVSEISEPLGKILKAYKRQSEEVERVKKENQTLVGEIRYLEGLLKEKHKLQIPAVSALYRQLFNYSIETVKKDVVIDADGKASITTSILGITPNVKGNPIRTLSHIIYLPEPLGEAPGITGSLQSFDVLSKPKGLKMETSFKRESKGKGVLTLSLPEGLAYKPQQTKLSYGFSYELEKAFLMVLEEAMVAYGQRTVHNMILEWSSCFVKRPTKKLISTVLFPEGYNPTYLDIWVWLTEVSFLESEENLAPKLLLNKTDGITLTSRDNRMLATLSVEDPLLGFSYGIVWQPLSKMRTGF
jgi:transcriptional regulator with XRE-family HTH domain